MQIDAAKGESVILYTDPDSTGILPSEQSFLKELEKKLEIDPSFIVPSQYKKVAEKDITYTYELLWAKDESIKICSEILDELLSDNLGIHFIEPAIKYITKIKVRPKNKL